MVQFTEPEIADGGMTEQVIVTVDGKLCGYLFRIRGSGVWMADSGLMASFPHVGAGELESLRRQILEVK